MDDSVLDESGHVWPTWKRVGVEEVDDERSPTGGVSPLLQEIGVGEDAPLAAQPDELLLIRDL